MDVPLSEAPQGARGGASDGAAAVGTARAVAAIVLATAIWGYGFIASVHAMRIFDPLWLTSVRFLVAVALAAPLLLWRRRPGVWTGEQVKMALLPAAVVAVMMALQTWGLTRTSVVNSGFITTLYVVFVPLLEVAVLGRRIGLWHCACVALALFGTALMCGWQAGQVNLGDVATLAAAVLAACHILLIERIAPRARSVLAFNTLQSGFAGLFTLPFALLFAPWPTPAWDRVAVFGFFYLVVLSTSVGFMLQLIAQRRLSPGVASLLYLLESPFAAFFAWLFQGDTMSREQLVGGGLILAAAVGAVKRKRQLMPPTPARSP